MSVQQQVFTIYDERQSTNLVPTAPPADSAFTYSSPPPYNDGVPRNDQPPAPPLPPVVPVVGVLKVRNDDVERNPKPNQPNKTQLAFDNKSIRAGFIRKVFALLSCMLAIVGVMITIFLCVNSVQQFIQTNAWLYWISYLVFLFTFIIIMCCENLRRRFPGNFICLLLVTLSLGYMVATISSFYDVYVVLLAIGICIPCCLAVIVFAIQTRFNLLSCVGLVFILVFVMLEFGCAALLCSFVFESTILYAVYASLGALVVMLFLAIDTQLIMGGKNKRCQLSEEEYIFAAVQLFLDIVYVFLYILICVAAVAGKK